MIRDLPSRTSVPRPERVLSLCNDRVPYIIRNRGYRGYKAGARFRFPAVRIHIIIVLRIETARINNPRTRVRDPIFFGSGDNLSLL